MKIKTLLEKHQIKPDPMKDQFFLKDEKIIKKMIDLAEIAKKDVVLEIGAGPGNLTKPLAQKAGKVIAFEIDESFKPLLSELPKNVEIHFKSAWDYVQLRGKYKHQKAYNKIVANPPYSLVEPLLHNLTFLDYDKVILIVPLKAVRTIERNQIFASFFKVKLVQIVGKEKFYPQPKTNSAIIELIQLPDPVETKDMGLFLRQYIYQHEQQKIKNSLMEGLIKFHQLALGKSLTKNQARDLIEKAEIPNQLLEIPPLGFEIYDQVDTQFS